MKRSGTYAVIGVGTLLAAASASAQNAPRRGRGVPPQVAAGPDGAPPAPGGAPPGTPPGAPNTPFGATGAPGGVPTTPVIGAGGKATGDTTNLTQFEQGQEFEPRNPNYKVAFSLEDADLPELVRVIGQLTGKRFIFGKKVREIKATIYSPQKITVAEAYQAFLSILETNGLTVIPHGRFLKIVETGGAATQGTPMVGPDQGATGEDRYITRIYRLAHVGADDVANVLGHFKSKDGDITVYGPGNLLIITDTGSNIRRMMTLVEEIDVGGAGDQVYIEPVHYGSASDLATRINDVFDLKSSGSGGSGASSNKGGAPPSPAAGGGGGVAAGGDLHVGKVLADDRTNSLVIVATERAYLRILEFLKRIDVPQTGEGEIHVLSLQHADATDLSKTITEIVTGAAQASTPGGAAGRPGAAGGTGGGVPVGIFEGLVKVSADKATNSLVVTSSLRDYASLRSVIDRLDLPRRQVFIEAVIMDLAVNRSLTLGLAFHGGLPVGPNGENIMLGGFNALKTAGPISANTDILQGAALGIRGATLDGSQNLFGFAVPKFGAAINALAADGDSDVLSTPHLLATDNVAAEINVGENIALQQTNIGAALGGAAAGGAAAGLGALGGLGGLGFGGQSQRQDVGTKISITPHLNESNEVRLELQEEISEAREPQGAAQVVPITKRTVKTTLVVRDQQTVVIGGLMRNRLVHSVQKMPILGDIPLLGMFFRTTSNQAQKSNLVLVLTPYIIREQADLRTVFERKLQERQDFLDHYFVFSEDNDYQPPKDYTRTNGLIEDIRQAFLHVDEQKLLDEKTRPREVKTHQAGEPLLMPAPGKSAAPGAAGANTPPPAPPPNINVAPPVRNLDKVER